MSIDVAEAAGVPRTAAERPRHARWIALGVVGALLVGGATAALTYRHTVTSERQATFDAVSQAQWRTAEQAMSEVGFGTRPADAAAVSQLVNLQVAYPDPNHRITVSTPRMRLGGDTQYLQIDSEMYSYDLPGWVGDRSQFLSILLFGTYKSDASGASSDVGSCVIRIGSPFEPVLTEETTLPNGYLANPCSSQHLVLLGID